jgi:hypothetical protein
MAARIRVDEGGREVRHVGPGNGGRFGDLVPLDDADDPVNETSAIVFRLNQKVEQVPCAWRVSFVGGLCCRNG